MGTIGTINSKEKGKKYLMKKEEAMPSSRSAGESRKSAPDVIIIAGCNTSHWEDKHWTNEIEDAIEVESFDLTES